MRRSIRKRTLCTQNLNSDGADLLLVIPRTLPASQRKFHGFRVLLSNMDWIKSILLCYSLYSMINKFGTIMAGSTLGFHQLGRDCNATRYIVWAFLYQHRLSLLHLPSIVQLLVLGMWVVLPASTVFWCRSCWVILVNRYNLLLSQVKSTQLSTTKYSQIQPSPAYWASWIERMLIISRGVSR